DYLRSFASEYFNTPINPEDIVWTFSGTRPLYDDQASSATEATRDYVLSLNEDGAPLLSVFGGKITTYRKLAEAAMDKMASHFKYSNDNWTAKAALPGGDFPHDGVPQLLASLQADYPFLEAKTATRLIRTYGTDAAKILGTAKTANDLGEDFGAGLTATEVRWLCEHEFAVTAEDILWRRTKLGLHFTPEQADQLKSWLAKQNGHENIKKVS
ncbi:MAG TPA: glycerol-3-phosphate dehydrogenase, partial [Rhodobacteraceae bacterium]|nr:glycerol-3-phosphate dehydrogenase [Paracoccaceae bacterium]